MTVCLNVRDTLRLTMESVKRQTFPGMEHVIIDGGSRDDTTAIAMEYNPAYIVSEKDNGIYDAMDKGAKAATGDVVIFLNAGDTFFDNGVAADVARFFDRTKADIVFGNLMPVYLRHGETHDHGAFTAGQMLDLGYMVNRRCLYDESIHHQATFARRWIFDHCTFRCEKPEATGEYNLLLNAVFRHAAVVKHIPRPVSRFPLGGSSTRKFDDEWAKYVKARDILRSIYMPDFEAIRVRGDAEFLEGMAQVNRQARRAAIKNVVRRSAPFRLYARIATNLSGRIVDIAQPRLVELLELHTQRLFADLKVTFEASATRLLQGVQASQVQIAASRLNALEQKLAYVTSLVDRLQDAQSAHFQIAASRQEVLEQRLADGLSIIDLIQKTVHATRADVQPIQGMLFRLEDMATGLGQAQARATAGSRFENSGFKVYSQWDEDGLIQRLIAQVPIANKTFVEIGCGDYSECNTRLLLTKDKWSGLAIDANSDFVERIKTVPLYWKHTLTAVAAFVNRDNVNAIICEAGYIGDIGLLSVDIDGVDYWVWQAIDIISPRIVVCEYNGLFGASARVTVPYDPQFDRRAKHFSMLYAGASLLGLEHLARQKGYELIGTNSAGNNAFFVRRDLIAVSNLRPVRRPFVPPCFRESRDAEDRLTYLEARDAVGLIADQPVHDVELGIDITISELQISTTGLVPGFDWLDGTHVSRKEPVPIVCKP